MQTATYPAFGRRIRALEEWVRTPFIARSKLLMMTPAGTAIRRLADLPVVGNASWRFRFDIVLYRQRNRPHPVLGVLSAGLAATSHKHEPDIPEDQ